MIKASLLIAAFVVTLSGCRHLNPDNVEPSDTIKGDNIVGLGVLQSLNERLLIIDELIPVQGRIIDSLTAIQKRSKTRIPGLEKRIEEMEERYNRLLQEREESAISHASISLIN